jgi:hypothetical protein
MKRNLLITVTAIAALSFLPMAFANKNGWRVACDSTKMTQDCTWYVDASGKIWSVGAEGRVEHHWSEEVDCTAQSGRVDNTRQGNFKAESDTSRCGIAYFSTDMGNEGKACNWKTSKNCGQPKAVNVTPAE